jgi:hypothetical protein
MVLATTGPVWSLTLTARATSPLAVLRPAAARLLAGALFVIACVPVAAHATSGQGLTAMSRWKSMDSCAVQAQRAYPDFTAESNAKRDAKLKECLAGQNLPPRGTPSDR